MGRRIKLKAVRKQKGKRERKYVRDDPNPDPNPGTSEEKTKLTAFDLINILTREHLKEMLMEYDIVSEKHNKDLNIPWEIESCRDLRKEKTSRLDKLKYGYHNISEERYIEKIIQLEKGKGKGKGKGSSSTFKKKDDPHPELDNFIKNDVFESVKGLHIYNIELFCANITYTTVGFHEFRYNQCPNVHEASNLLEIGEFSNRVVQETMLFLDITEEDMISEYIKENEIRILGFGLRQERTFVNLVITIPEICQCDEKKISFRCTETGVFFYVENHNEKKYVFEIENFANKINKNTSGYTLSGKHTVILHLKKMKQGRWKELFLYKNQTKTLWKFEMQNVLLSMNQDARMQIESIDFVWNIALILVNCHADLLRLPQDLNPVNMVFKNIDEMIFYYKTIIPFNPHLKALFYIYGGALLYRLTKSASSSKLKIFSKYETEVIEGITELIEKAGKKFEEGRDIYFQINYERAYSFFCEASNICTFPGNTVFKGICLYEMKRYKEAIMDSIFALRNLGPYHGLPSLFTILEYKINSGSVIHAVDMAISVEFNNKILNQYQKEGLKEMKRKGLYFLGNIFKSYSLIFQKKYKDAIPFLEQAESIVSIKSGLSSIILLLLYFISKSYEKVFILGKKILKDNNKYRDLLNFLFAMSAYYLSKLGFAMKYFEKITVSGLEDHTRIKILCDLMHTADDMWKDGKETKDLAGYYVNALQLVKDNDDLSARILTKLGVINFYNDDFKDAVKCFNSSINLCVRKSRKYLTSILVVRSVAHDKLGKVEEAKKDRKAVQKHLMRDDLSGS